MRYFLHLAYRGTAYHGWQRQPHSASVQQTIEETLSIVLNQPTEITGCGRTDAGVHAERYVAHFDYADLIPPHLLNRLNRMLPADIAIYDITQPGPSHRLENSAMHARYDASRRAYRYDLTGRKDPFRIAEVWHYHAFNRLDLQQLNAAASLLLDYDEFAPFCKSKSDAKTMRCDLRRSEWIPDPNGHEFHYHIAGDRFLRGMVRLIVGACVQVGRGALALDDLRRALDKQERLARSVSVPADGLYLVEVEY